MALEPCSFEETFMSQKIIRFYNTTSLRFIYLSFVRDNRNGADIDNGKIDFPAGCVEIFAIHINVLRNKTSGVDELK